MKTIHVDIETRAKIDIRTSGVTVYARHPQTSVLCVCYSEETEDEVHVWLPGDPVPEAFQGPFMLVAHNAAFERAIWTHKMLGVGFIEPVAYECTMIAAYQRNLPGSLEACAKALGCTHLKDKEGKAVMLRMTKFDYEEETRKRFLKQTERKTNPITVEEAERLAAEALEQDHKALIEYCKQDVRAEKDIHRIIKMKEPGLMELDHKINTRGIWVDIQTVNAIRKVIDVEAEEIESQLAEITDGEVTGAKQTAKLTIWLRQRGYRGENIRAEVVQEALKNPEGMTPEAIEVLNIRRKLSLGSLGKYKAIVNSYHSDTGRVYDLFQLRGAAQTGRYAGRRIQLQNLPRLEIKDYQIELLISLFRKGDRDSIRFLCGDVFYAAKQLLRPMFGCPAGLIVSDFAQIEARLVSWVAGDEETLASFEGDPYKDMAAKIYGKPVSEVNDAERFIGKTCVLGAGYGLGSRGFYNQLRMRGVSTTEEESEIAIRAYRAANPNTVRLWYALNDAFIDCIRSPGSCIHVNGMLSIESFAGDKVGVVINLPSGRRLYYHDCKLADGGEFGPRITFLGEGWERTETYGGKLLENIIQAIANDILNHALFTLDFYGYEVVAHVHDETVIQNVTEKDVDKINSIMETAPLWASDFPLKAETKFCPNGRYTK